MIITTARPAEFAEAFALVLGGARADLDDRLAHISRQAACGELDLEHLLVARSGAAIVGAVFSQIMPGALAVVAPPRSVAGVAAVEDALVAAALRQCSAARVVQAFVPPEQSECAAPLERAGFRRVTRVLQMQRHGPAPVQRQDRVRLIAVGVAEPGFRDVLARSHDESLDCPEMHALRTADELLAGYAADPAAANGCFLATAGTQAVGALIVSADVLCFIGIVPESRGRGFGRAVLEAACALAPTMSLVVDARNSPALHLYRAFEFTVVGARDVYLFSAGAASPV